MPNAQDQTARSSDLSGWIALAMVGFVVVLLGGMTIWGPRPERRLDHGAMCARHDMTFRPARRGPDFCMKADGSLYDFRQVTRSDIPIYKD